MKLSRSLLVAAPAAALILFSSVSGPRADEKTNPKPAAKPAPAARTESAAVNPASKPDNVLHTSTGDIPVDGYDPSRQYVAILDTDFGKIVAEFWPDIAPNHVKNFIYLAKNKKYDGVVFHRAVENFMIQGGDPYGNGTGDFGYKIKGEFSDRKHVEGVLSMARSASPDSAGSQFFIMLGASPWLDGKYSAFGQVLEGMDAVHKVGSSPVRGDQLINKVKMNSVTIQEKSQWLSQKGAKQK